MVINKIQKEENMNLKKFLLVAALATLLSGCIGQGEDTTTSSTSEDIHQYSENYEKDESGHWKVCTTINHTDTTAKEAHKYEEWKTLNEASHHKDKVEHRLCTVCEYEEKRTIDGSATHTYVLKNDENKHWYETTCNHETPLRKGEEEHKFGEWATLTKEGLHTDRVEHRLCEVCNYEEKRTISNSGTHNYDTSTWKFDKTHHWHESTCGHTPALKIDVTPHAMSEWKEKTAATYIANRVDERNCTFCDYSETKEVEGTILPKIVRALSLKPIANRTFDGLEKPVLESDLVFDNKEGGLTIEYRAKGTGTFSSSSIPTEAGTYEYRVTLGETEKYTKVEKIGEFIIDKLALDLPTITTYEDATEVSAGLSIYEYSVASLTNNWIDYVSLCVPEKYDSFGRHTVPTSELYLDDDNFTLNAGSTVSINLVNYDTRNNIAYISGDIQILTGGMIAVPITLTQGTMENISSIWFYGYGDWLYVSEMKMNGITITKATIGDEIDLFVRPPVDDTKLTKGMLVSTKSNLPTYDSAFATFRAYTTEEGGINEHSSGFIRYIYFLDTMTEHTVEVTYPDVWSKPGETQESVRFDFSESIINYENRPFKIKTTDTKQIIAEGTISSPHKHTDSINTTGRCEDCNFSKVVNMAFKEGSDEATSSIFTYLNNGIRVYYITLTRTPTSASKYTFIMHAGGNTDVSSSYSLDVYDSKTGAKLTLISRTYTLSSGTSELAVRVVSKCHLTSGTNYYGGLKVIRQYIAE